MTTRSALAGLILLSGTTMALGQDVPGTAAILADIRTNNMSAEEVLASEPIASLNVVSLADFSGSAAEDLDAVLKNAEGNFGAVRAAVERDPALEAALAEHDVPVSEVVAATRDEDNHVTVYYGPVP